MQARKAGKWHKQGVCDGVLERRWRTATFPEISMAGRAAKGCQCKVSYPNPALLQEEGPCQMDTARKMQCQHVSLLGRILPRATSNRKFGNNRDT